MPINRDFVGREYPASATYEVGREHVRQFADAIGDQNPLYRDHDAAVAAGHRDVLAPPTFLTTLGFRFGLDSPVVDPALGLDYASSCTASSASTCTARSTPATCSAASSGSPRSRTPGATS